MSIVCILILFLFCYIRTSKTWILRTPVQYNNYFPRYNGFSQLNAKKKAGRVLITLECSISRKLGVPPSRYYTTKNKINTPHRLELMKYNKFLRKHTLHKEIR